MLSGPKEHGAQCRRLSQGRMGTIDSCAPRLPSDSITPQCQGLTCSNQSLKFCFLTFFFFWCVFSPIIWGTVHKGTSCCFLWTPSEICDRDCAAPQEGGMKDPFLRVTLVPSTDLQGTTGSFLGVIPWPSSPQPECTNTTGDPTAYFFPGIIILHFQNISSPYIGYR